MRQIVRNGEYTYSAPRTAEGHSDRCTAKALAHRAGGAFDGPAAAARIPRGNRQTADAESGRGGKWGSF
jgi:hypothetical protein